MCLKKWNEVTVCEKHGDAQGIAKQSKKGEVLCCFITKLITPSPLVGTSTTTTADDFALENTGSVRLLAKGCSVLPLVTSGFLIDQKYRCANKTHAHAQCIFDEPMKTALCFHMVDGTCAHMKSLVVLKYPRHSVCV